jgi:hypothetical protein
LMVGVGKKGSLSPLSFPLSSLLSPPSLSPLPFLVLRREERREERCTKEQVSGVMVLLWCRIRNPISHYKCLVFSLSRFLAFSLSRFLTSRFLTFSLSHFLTFSLYHFITFSLYSFLATCHLTQSLS